MCRLSAAVTFAFLWSCILLWVFRHPDACLFCLQLSVVIGQSSVLHYFQIPIHISASLRAATVHTWFQANVLLHTDCLGMQSMAF